VPESSVILLVGHRLSLEMTRTLLNRFNCVVEGIATEVEAEVVQEGDSDSKPSKPDITLHRSSSVVMV